MRWLLEALTPILETFLVHRDIIAYRKFLLCLAVASLLGVGLFFLIPDSEWILGGSIAVGTIVGVYLELKTKKK